MAQWQVSSIRSSTVVLQFRSTFFFFISDNCLNCLICLFFDYIIYKNNFINKCNGQIADLEMYHFVIIRDILQGLPNLG